MLLGRWLRYWLVFTAILLAEGNQTQLLTGELVIQEISEENLSSSISETNETQENNTSAIEEMTFQDVESSVMEEIKRAETKEDKFIQLQKHIERSSLIMVAEVETNTSDMTVSQELISFKPMRMIKGGEDFNSSIQLKRDLFQTVHMHDQYLLFLRGEGSEKIYALAEGSNSALLIRDNQVDWRYRPSNKKPEKAIDDVVEQIEEIVIPPEEEIPEC